MKVVTETWRINAKVYEGEIGIGFYDQLASALDAILAEREELLRDKARLDKIESSATYIEIDGDDYYIGNNNFDTIREFIESKMKGEE